MTYGAFSDRVRYLNLRKAIDEMFRLGVVPIINENDVISTDEIEEVFGDNDKLSALVASKMDADLLILLTDVEGLYDRNPESDPDAKTDLHGRRDHKGHREDGWLPQERKVDRRYEDEDKCGQDSDAIGL